ncbi:MAG: nucleotidyltransferase family protein [Pseudomonadota bacterium]
MQKNILLKSIFAKDMQQSITYFEKWASSVDFDAIKWRELCLLPQINKKLGKNILDQNILGRIKDFQEYIWCRNNLLIKRLKEVTEELAKHRIDIIVLKGAALQLSVYKDLSLRPMADNDVIVKIQDLERTCELLSKLDFVPETKVVSNSFENDYFTTSHAYAFKDIKYNKALELELDVHVHLLTRRYSSKYYLDLWERTEVVPLGSYGIKILRPTEQFFHILVHSFEWEFDPNLIWAVDLYEMLELYQIDWNELIALARFYDVVLEVKAGLFMLKKEYGFDIPDSIFNQLSEINVSFVSKMEFFLKQKRFGFFRNFVLAYIAYLRSQDGKGSFITFIKKRWGVKRTYELPYYTFKEYIKRFKH